jgi:hypothetical protein
VGTVFIHNLLLRLCFGKLGGRFRARLWDGVQYLESGIPVLGHSRKMRSGCSCSFTSSRQLCDKIRSYLCIHETGIKEPMAKTKSRKRRSSRSRGNPRNYSQIYQDDKTIETEAPAAVPATTEESVDWVGEYGYVVQDLRLLAVVSALIFIGMIGVGLLLG